jgi:hypothetical protein
VRVHSTILGTLALPQRYKTNATATSHNEPHGMKDEKFDQGKQSKEKLQLLPSNVVPSRVVGTSTP